MAGPKRARPTRKAAKAKTKPLSAIAAKLAHIIEAGFAADGVQHQSDRKQAPPVHLLGKAKILKITGVSFPTVWAWMRAGTFPRSRIVGGKSMWRSDEIDAWLAGLPLRPLKPLPSDQTIEQQEPA
jgi:predicted DNA-binding transcriptional regulator AlpA